MQAGTAYRVTLRSFIFSCRMPSLTTYLPDIPAQITHQQLLTWCEALGVQRSEAAAIMGKSPEFWSRLEAGTAEIRLSQLNTLLSALAVRRAALAASA